MKRGFGALYPISVLLLATVLSSVVCWGSSASGSGSGSGSGSISTPAPPIPPSVTPIPPTPAGTGDQSALLDAIFSLFIEEVDERGTILTILESAANVTSGRIVYYEQSTDRKGFLFGSNVVVRLRINAASVASPKPAAQVRATIIQLVTAQDSRMKNIDLVQAVAVPTNFKVFRYDTRTKWDLLYTFGIISVGLVFMSLVGFGIFKIVIMVRRAREDARAAKEEAEEQAKEKAEKNKPAEPAAGGRPSTTVAGTMGDGTATRTALTSAWEDPDDEEMHLVEELRQMRDRQNGLLHVPELSAAEALAQRQSARTNHLMSEFDLPPEGGSIEGLLGPSVGVGGHGTGAPGAGGRSGATSPNADIDRRLDAIAMLPSEHQSSSPPRATSSSHMLGGASTSPLAPPPAGNDPNADYL